MKHFFIYFITLLFSISCYCATNVIGIAKETNTVTFAELPNDAVIIKVGDKVLTKNDVKQEGMVHLQLRANKEYRKKTNKQDAKYIRMFEKNSFARFISELAIEYAAESNKVVATDKTIQNVTDETVKRFGRDKHKINDLRYMLGQNAWRLDKMIRHTATQKDLTTFLITHPKYEVTAQMITNRLNTIKEYNIKAHAKEKDIYQVASNVWNEVTKDTKQFDSLAKKYSQDENIEYGSEWGDFSITELSKDEAFATLFSMKANEITPPIESDNGIAIVRKDKENYKDESGEVHCVFSRIFFQLPLLASDETEEVIRENYIADETKRRYEVAINPIVKHLESIAEYPYGTNIFRTVSKKEHSHTPKK